MAVDPVDGTTLMSKGMPNALAVLAVSERGAMFDPSAVFYMEKLAVGPAYADVIDINAGVAENLRRIAKVKGTDVSEVTVCVLDRRRHDDLVEQIRRTGAGIRFISDGDIAGAIAAARGESDVDVLMGIGGTPEGIISACALKCMGGAMQAKLWPRDDAGAGEGAGRRARPGPGAGHRRSGHRRQLLLRGDRGHLRRPAARACATGRAARTPSRS